MTLENNKSYLYKLSYGIVRSRKLIVACVVAMIVFSCFSIGWVELEEDFTYYLQDSAEAKQGLIIMNDEFTMFENLRVMAEDVTQEEAKALADQLSEIDGVYMVTFDADSLDSYHDGKALLEVTLGDKATSESNVNATNRIAEALEGYDYAMYSTYEDINSILIKEMSGVSVIVAIVVIGVLLFTSSTYGEILVLIATFAVAAVINMGTNFLLGRISLISNTVTLVMQLALSVDYAIILCNRYKEEQANLPAKQAAVSALSKVIPEIGASSLTTIAGLAAMTFMQFRLGADMGIVLIKSILVAILTVFLFMPAMLVFCSKLMDRTKHRNFVPEVPFLGKFAYAGRYVIPIFFVVLIVFGYIGQGKLQYDYAGDMMEHFHKNEYDIARERISEDFGENNMIAVLVPAGDYEKEMKLIDDLSACYETNTVMGLAGVEAMNGLRLGDGVSYRDVMWIADVDEVAAKAMMVFAASENGNSREVTEDLENYKIPLIDLFMAMHSLLESDTLSEMDFELTEEQQAMLGGTDESGAEMSMSFEMSQEQQDMINDLYDQLETAKKQLQSDKHSCIAVYADLPLQSSKTFEFLGQIHNIANRYYPEDEVILTGDAVSARDFADTFESDNRIVTTFSIVLVMIILLFTFKSVGMPVLLIFVIQGSIWLNFAIPAIMGKYVFFMCILIVSSIQMGANIDYAIVVSSRYSQLRAEGTGPKEAVTDALNLAFPTVITSGTMMIAAGLLIGLRVSQTVIAGMGLYIGIGTSISLVLVNVALPAILILGDGFARATTLGFLNGNALSRRRPLLRRLALGALALAVVYTLVSTPFTMKNAQNDIVAAKKETDSLLQRTRELHDIAIELEAEQEKINETKLEFTEHLLTDRIGVEKLEEGKEQYEAGAVELDEYKALLEAGELEYSEGVKQYRAGLAQLAAGQAELASGRAQYEEGKAQYEEAKIQLAEGQAEYDAGLAEYEAGKEKLESGQAEYDAGEAELAEGKQQYQLASFALSLVKPIYDDAVSVYNDYESAQARLAELEAAEEPDEEAIAAAQQEVENARIVYETTLLGVSFASIKADYEEAKAELDAAAATIAEGEAKLAAGKAELDEGYAQLAEAEEQLAAGKAALDEGYAQLAEAEAQLAAAEREIASGEAQVNAGQWKLSEAKRQLDEARRQLDDGAQEINKGDLQLKDAEKLLEDGQRTLTENRKKLESDLSMLDEISDKQEKLDAGLEILRSDKSVAKQIRFNSSDSEICTLAEQYYDSQLQKLSKDNRMMNYLAMLLLLAAALAVVGLVLRMKKKDNSAVVVILVCALCALVTAFLWNYGKSGYFTALALAVTGAVAADSIFRQIRQDKAVRMSGDGYGNELSEEV